MVWTLHWPLIRISLILSSIARVHVRLVLELNRFNLASQAFITGNAVFVRGISREIIIHIRYEELLSFFFLAYIHWLL